ncbi:MULTISPECIES: hypothetical protein [unclassified Bradyrhizobium]|uniref:hypothetical protein n=1 Tax=unclassified Bradyrhizobium TaxID=2631580 RepID=UPI0028E2C28A|nr:MULTISPECIES: hypothetical protein [unclassified Bradyrhizobium]
MKFLFWDGNGLCLFTKRIDQAASCGRRWRGRWLNQAHAGATHDADRMHRLARARTRMEACDCRMI